MDEKIVKTIKGAKHPEKNCRLIEGHYYLVGNNNVEDSGDVYLINGRYIRASTGRVVFDHFEDEYKLKNASLIEGIIGSDGEELILGYFTRSDLYNVKVILKDMCEKVAIASNVLNYAYREKKSDGVFYHISLLEATKFHALRGVSREVKESLPYDSKGSIAKALKNYESNYNPVICPNAQIVGEALKEYTFGLEFETSVGIVPNSKLNFLPLIPLRDGSIDGLEYATVPLQGPKGVQAIIDCADELKRRTDFNEGCSLHLHIGGMPRTVEFTLAFYKLISVFQNEIFSMFPLYKKYNFGIKRKNYSAPFPFEQINFRMDPVINFNDKKALNRNFDILFQYLSGGHSFADYQNDLSKVEVHPQDPGGNAKWNIKHRYSFINFIPLIFGNHQTIEFRIHTPTYDAGKIIDFLMLNVFLIDYVSINWKHILAGTDILLRRTSLHAFVEEYVPNYVKNGHKNIYSQLSHYVSERRTHTENLTRDRGVVYTEDQIRTARYLKYNTYKFIKKSERALDFGEIYFGESIFSKGFSDAEIRLKAQEIANRYRNDLAKPPVKKKMPERVARKERRGARPAPGNPIAEEIVKPKVPSFQDWWTSFDSPYDTSKENTSSDGPVNMFSKGELKEMAEGEPGLVFYPNSTMHSETSEGEVKNSVDESNIL